MDDRIRCTDMVEHNIELCTAIDQPSSNATALSFIDTLCTRIVDVPSTSDFKTQVASSTRTSTSTDPIESMSHVDCPVVVVPYLDFHKNFAKSDPAKWHVNDSLRDSIPTHGKNMSSNSIEYEINTTTREIIKTAIKNLHSYTIKTSLAIKPGENWVSVILKIKVNGEDENQKKTRLNFFVKVAPTELGIRNFFLVKEMFQREAYVYNKVIPEFISIQKINNVNEIFQPFVKFYGCSLTEFNEVIVMDDMSSLGYRSHDAQKYVDYEHALMYMKTIGKFHALAFAVQDQRPALFNEFKRNTKEPILTNNSAGVIRKTVYDLFCQGIERLNLEGYTNEYNKYKQLIERFPNIILEVLSYRDPGSCIVINHGDCQIRNVLFKYEDAAAPNRPTNICLLDWQVCFIGPPAYDISLFLFLNSNKSLRDKHYHHLINEYYASLSQFLIQLGSDPKKMIPFNSLQESLKKFSLFGVFVGIWLSLGKVYKIDEHPEIFTTADQNEMADQFKKHPQNSDVYFNVVRDILLDYISYGYDI
ncbi:hypothetical protein RN001_000459 [Aquatica leii]|uniref:CHK kinase-like domain-containing protein n=1 Tax=Aquatica leii TaxID=1421715 RepID=A0AAN7SQJ8_9COLE|nr:hypothetical protein RN001_000459 [Aquatica leii]